MTRKDGDLDRRATVGECKNIQASEAADAPRPARAAGHVVLGGDRSVARLGYGALRLTGGGGWGPPGDRATALGVLRAAVALGVDFVDTADSYGPYFNEGLVREALHPYRDLTIATKVGLVRTGPDRAFHVLGRPAYLRTACEGSLRRLGVDTIDLYQLHKIDPEVALEDQIGTLDALRGEGKIRHIGLSSVTVAELERASGVAPIASVTNRFNVLDRDAGDVLVASERIGAAFLPWLPTAVGQAAHPVWTTTLHHAGLTGLRAVATELGVAPAQVALAWLLDHSPAIVAIPGTSNIDHLRQNVAAASIRLTPEHRARLDALVP